MVKLVSGSFMFIIGLFMCFTGVGAIIGLPMVGGGLWMAFVGMTSMSVTAVKTGVAAGKVVREMRSSREGATYIEAEPVSTSAADEIAKLAALLTAGHLTQAEFDQRKAQILSRA